MKWLLRNVAITANDADYGGGIYVSEENIVTFSECEITHNTARYGGGIFAYYYATIEIQGAYFYGNTSEHDGGAVSGVRITLHATRAEFTQNSAALNGGAIAVDSDLSMSGVDVLTDQNPVEAAIRTPTYVSISDSVFEANRALGQPVHAWDALGGGAIFAQANALDISHSTFRINKASFGGAILNAYYGSHISDCAFLENQSDLDGGAIYLYDAVDATLFVRNHAGRDGGGIFGYFSSALSRSAFVGNSASRGGAIFGTADARATEFMTNSASEAGGAIYFDGPARVLDSVFVANSSDVGGALYNAGQASIYNTTMVKNSAVTGGGAVSNVGLENVATSLAMTNSILWGNSAAMHAQLWINEKAYDTNITASDLEGSGGSANWDSSYGIDLGDNLDLDPDFAHLPDDGGDGFGDNPATPNIDESLNDNYGDLRLQPGSPCINAGNPDFVPQPGDTDLDGHARVLCGRVDMGAYEFGIGDFDCDQVVDLGDMAGWDECATDPGDSPSPRPSPFMGEGASGCEAFDFDADGDVDLRDLADWYNLFTGG